MSSTPLTKYPTPAERRREVIDGWAAPLGHVGGLDPTSAFIIACDALIRAELSNGPQFTADEAAGMLVMHQGCMAEPFGFGSLLADAMEDDPDLYEPTPELMTKLRSLTLTQDWGLRMLLEVHEGLRRDEGGRRVPYVVTLKEIGFPVI